jgi:hypothetical protein
MSAAAAMPQQAAALPHVAVGMAWLADDLLAGHRRSEGKLN